MKISRFLKPPIVREWTRILKEKGIKGFVVEKGWKVLIAVIVFYLIRDTILYVLIPVLVAQGFICN